MCESIGYRVNNNIDPFVATAQKMMDGQIPHINQDFDLFETAALLLLNLNNKLL